MATLTYQQLPSAYILVRQYDGLFLAEVIKKHTSIANCHCDLHGLICFINDWQLRGAGPVYRQLPMSQQFEPLSYEQAKELYRAELANA